MFDYRAVSPLIYREPFETPWLHEQSPCWWAGSPTRYRLPSKGQRQMRRNPGRIRAASRHDQPDRLPPAFFDHAQQR